ncbi:MAG: hypothetical protein JXQ96_18745 [Cyclobacteriaceae bacterium]
MKRRLSSIFSLVSCFVLLAVGQANAQEVLSTDSLTVDVVADSLEVTEDVLEVVAETTALEVNDSIPSKIIYPFMRELSVILDYGKIFGYATGVEKKNEIGIQANVKKFLIVVAEAGYSVLNPNDSYVNADYQVSGQYFRVGAGINKKITEKNNLTISLRYGMSMFKDEGTVTVASTSGFYDTYQSSFSRTSLTASWYEFVLGSEKRMRMKKKDEFSRLSVGFYFRLRFMSNYDKQQPYDVFTVPGYGRTFDNSVPAVNLYLRYTFFSRKVAE